MVDKYPILNFPAIDNKIKQENGVYSIWDTIRSIYVALTPEEWVRQHCVQWLIQQGYPQGRCSIEKRVPGSTLRYDAVWMDANLQPFLIIECKAPGVRITPQTFRQGGWYNLTMQAPFILLTNGLASFCLKLNPGSSPDVLASLPKYEGNETS